MDDKYKQFLKELAELSSKHGIYIDGCQCCGSPFSVELESGHGYKVDEGHDGFINLEPVGKDYNDDEEG